jgi:RNA polymerase sigma-70 factor (ECF subfamily)
MVSRDRSETRSAGAERLSDGALLAAVLAGEAKAPFELWVRFSPLVGRLLQRYFGPGTDNQDLGQEVFLRVFSRLSELRDDLSLEGFVIGVTLGVARNEARRRKFRRIVRLSDEGVLPDIPAPGFDVESWEKAQRLYRLLESVGAETRGLFVARAVEQLSMEALAEAYGWSLGTAKRRTARALARANAALLRDPVLKDLGTEGAGKAAHG